MLRMIDLIRTAEVPHALMQSASRGALALPAQEMIEILVYLAMENSVFAETARLTLAGWDEKSCQEAASNPDTVKEVLDYLISADNLRPALLPSLLENPAIAEDALVQLARSGSWKVAETMAKSERVGRSQPILKALHANANLVGTSAGSVKAKLAALDNAGSEDFATDDILDEDMLDDETALYLSGHTAELAAEGEKPFQPIGGFTDELHVEEEPPLVEAAVAAGQSGSAAASAPAKPGFQKKTHLTTQEQRGSALQKISKLDVKGRIQLALKGNKEERAILVRDGTKLVALAVLDSPKISDGEVERFASQKNVLEAVLRGIPMRRRFLKNYLIIRNLVFNPRTPLDVTLGLMKNLLAHDLKNLSGNKDVSETLRKLAHKMFREKLNPNKKSGE